MSKAKTNGEAGLMVFVSSPRAILADKGELFILLAGRPADPGYVEALSGLHSDMDVAGERFSFTGRLAKNRRGSYRAISTGVTHGGGSKASYVLLHVRKS